MFEPLPPPAGSEPPAAHPKLGRYTHRWPYIGADGALQGYQCRFDTPGGKEFRPLRYGIRDGREGWHWKGWARRPARSTGCRAAGRDPDAPVLVVEGEKAADAAAGAVPRLCRRLAHERGAVAAQDGLVAARRPRRHDLARRRRARA